MCVCMYVCMYICMYVYMYVCIYVCICMYMCVYMCIHVCIYICTSVHVNRSVESCLTCSVCVCTVLCPGFIIVWIQRSSHNHHVNCSC